ncbi:MAG: CoA-binding protein [Candidatus Hydrothermarchaeales archaeon]
MSGPDTNAKILAKYKTVAVVGLSRDPKKDSHKVASYLKSVGFRIIPVNPSADEILGENVYRDLADIPEKVDVVNIFRPSDEVGPIVDKAIKIGAKAVWLQLGIINEEAAQKAAEAGLDVVMDWCMMTEHKRLLGSWI